MGHLYHGQLFLQRSHFERHPSGDHLDRRTLRPLARRCERGGAEVCIDNPRRSQWFRQLKEYDTNGAT